MTKAAATISFKAPARILDGIPAPGNGRSRSIVEVLDEKISRRKQTQWKPTTPLGRKFAGILKKGRKERGPEVTEAEFERDLRERQGRNF